MVLFWDWITSEGTGTVFGASVTFIFGLFALIFGALFNSHLNRRRDKRLRDKEADAVAAALYGEIILLRVEVAQIAKIVGKTYFSEGLDGRSFLKFDETFLERNTLGDAILYPALASKLGLLEPELVLAITRFHADYQALRTWLPRLVKKATRPFRYSVLHVLEPANNAVFGVVPALRKIELMLGVHEPALDPDMGDALSVIDIERESFQN